MIRQQTLFLSLALLLPAAPAASQDELKDAVSAARAAFQGRAPEGAQVPAVQGAAAEADPESPTVSELKAAQARLEDLLRSLGDAVKAEPDPARKVALYELKEKAQASLDAVSRALAAAERDAAQGGRQAKVDQALAEAKYLNKLLALYLGQPDFAGTVHMKRQAFELEVGADAVYAEVRKRVPFLGGAVGGRIRVNPGAGMLSQFNALKAEYYTTLLEASQAIKAAGGKPFADARLKGMADWGRDTKVIAPGQGWMQAVPVLTGQQYPNLQ